MDVSPVLTVTLNDSMIKNKIGMAVMAKQMDTEKQMGAAMIDMLNRSVMEKSINPELGGSIDISI